MIEDTETYDQGVLLETAQYGDIKTKYPLHQVRHIKNGSTGAVHELPAEMAFEDGIIDEDDFLIEVWCKSEQADDGAYEFYTCYDEDKNQFICQKFTPNEEVEE